MLDVDKDAVPVILSLGSVSNVMVRTTERIANTAVQGTASIRHVTNGQGPVMVVWIITQAKPARKLVR